MKKKFDDQKNVDYTHCLKNSYRLGTFFLLFSFRFSSSNLGPLTLGSLSTLSKQKIDALQCHLKLEFSLQEKHHILQTKLAQLNQLKSINDELIHLNALIKRDMSHGQSFIGYLRRLKEEEKQLICDWKSSNPTIFRRASASISVSPRQSYSTVMKQMKICLIDAPHSSYIQRINRNMFDTYACRVRQGLLPIFPSIDFDDENEKKNKFNLMACTFFLTQIFIEVKIDFRFYFSASCSN